jgi:hypothetical protein
MLRIEGLAFLKSKTWSNGSEIITVAAAPSWPIGMQPGGRG